MASLRCRSPSTLAVGSRGGSEISWPVLRHYPSKVSYTLTQIKQQETSATGTRRRAEMRGTLLNVKVSEPVNL